MPASPFTAHIRFNWRSATAAGQTAPMNLALQPNATQVVDVTALQAQKLISFDAHWAAVVISAPVQISDLMAVAASYDQSGRYGAQTPFTDQLASHWEGGKWEVDGMHNSLVTVGNGGSKPAKAELTILYNQGRDQYQIEQMLAPDEQMLIDFGKLIRNQVPDKSGHVLPPELTSGAYRLRDLADHAAGGLYEGKVIVDKTYGHAAYGCGVCCGPEFALMEFDPLAVTTSATSTQTVQAPNSCGGGTQNVTGDFPTWWTDDTSIATASRNQIHGVKAGTTKHHAQSVPMFWGFRENANPCPLSQPEPSADTNVCAVPTNFHAYSCGDNGNGDLHFVYTWESTSGSLSDLTMCTVGEIVTYPGTQNPWPAPSPPFPPNTYANPTINDEAATSGTFTDDHLLRDTTFVKPYSASSYNATQYYRYKCTCSNNGNYVNLQGPLSIARSVSQNSNGSWKFTVTKSGCSATINPLP
jgi:hypothetical protein